MKILIFLMLAATMAVAQPRGAGHMHGMGGRGPARMSQDLNLTEEQQQKFDKLQAEFQKKHIGLRSSVQSLQVDLRGLIREEKPDRAKIEAKVKEIGAARSEMQSAFLGHWFDVNAMLTPEQQKMWKERPMMQGPGKGPGHFGRFGQGRGGRGSGCGDCPMGCMK